MMMSVCVCQFLQVDLCVGCVKTCVRVQACTVCTCFTCKIVAGRNIIHKRCAKKIWTTKTQSGTSLTGDRNNKLNPRVGVN